MTDLNYKVSKKIDDKWLSFGNVKRNSYGNMQLGIHVTALFKKIVAETEEGKWLNLSLFEDKPKEPK